MLRCLADRILGDVSRASRLMLDRDACLVLTRRTIEEQRAMRRAPVQQWGNKLAAGTQKSSTAGERSDLLQP
jgi:hypothetical protein